MPLLCSPGCEGNDCGPTSEWPTCSAGDETSGGGGRPGVPNPSTDDDPGEGEEPPENTNGGRRDSGRPSSSLDAGVSIPKPGPDDGWGAATPDAGDASTDTRVNGFDGGLDQGCTIDSDGRDGGACFGVYCDTALSALSALVSEQGACLGQSDLALACDGELARVVAACAQEDVLMLGFGRTVALCAARAPSLASASEACIDCYVDEMLCAVQSCLAPCLSGSSADCTSCRREHCGASFSACSGLPD